MSKGFTKLKKEIKKLSDYNRGFFTNFWIGYIHGIVDHKNYGDITEKEGQKIEKIICKGFKGEMIK